jgi:peptidyl-dipeptidase Dcp
MWAQVLDIYVFTAFKETDDVFDCAAADRCREFIYSGGNTVAKQELFRNFRGRDPDATFMPKNQGLMIFSLPLRPAGIGKYLSS